MALNPADIAAVSQLLDQALALPVSEREAWLAALPAEHQGHRDTLRDVLAQEAQLDTDSRLEAMPRLPTDDGVAHADDRVGPYRLLREIGGGGMGSVWLAERADGAYHRQVALKLPRLAWGGGLVDRMARERDIGARLEHPHIARLYDAGVDERGRPYLALEFVDGQPIDAWCEAQGLSVRDRLRLFVQVIRAVAYAHGHLIVHRDLKPSNVLVTADGQAHLLDFGIAKLLQEAGADEKGLTQQQGRVMTPHYASPEQVAGEPITVQSDVYSLGVLLYELLTGTLPTQAKRSTLGAVEDAILEGDAPPASSRVTDKSLARALRGEVDAILGKALQREPARRYATADALAQDIDRHLRGETVGARPDSLAYRARKTLRRHWVGFGATTAVLLALMVGAAAAWWQAREADRETQRMRIATQFVSEMFRANAQSGLRGRDGNPGSSGVEQAAQLIETRFAGQPDMQAELYGAVGRVYADIGASKLAVQYAKRQVAAWEQARAGPEVRVRALLLLADANARSGRYIDAETALREAARLLEPGTALGFEARAALAEVLSILEGKAPEATRLIDELMKLRWADPAIPTLGGAKLLGLRADLLAQQDRMNEAIPLFNAAIRTAVDVEGPASYWANLLRFFVADYLVLMRRNSEAFALYDDAMRALSGAGDTGRIQAVTLSTPFWARVAQYQARPPAEALRAVEMGRSTLHEFGSAIPLEATARVDFFIGRTNWFMGRMTEAYRVVSTSSPILLASTDVANWRNFILSTLGQAEMATGRHTEADTHFREVLRIRSAMGQANLPYTAFDWGRLAQNLVMQGRAADVDRELQAAPVFSAMRSATRGSTGPGHAIPLARARALFELGDVQAALRLMPEKGDVPLARDEGAVLRSELWCASGRAREGLQLMADLIDVRIAPVVEEDPALARLRSTAGLCALQLGDRKRAEAWAAQARQAFERQPGVSDWYKAPLIRLERELAGRTRKL